MKTLLIALSGWKKYPGLLFGIGVFTHSNRLGIIFHHTAKPGRSFWEQLFPERVKNPNFERLIEHLTSSTAIFMIVEGENAVQLIKERVIKTSIIYNKKEEGLKKILYSSESDARAQKDIDLLIGFMSQGRL